MEISRLALHLTRPGPHSSVQPLLLEFSERKYNPVAHMYSLSQESSSLRHRNNIFPFDVISNPPGTPNACKCVSADDAAKKKLESSKGKIAKKEAKRKYVNERAGVFVKAESPVMRSPLGVAGLTRSLVQKITFQLSATNSDMPSVQHQAEQLQAWTHTALSVQVLRHCRCCP